MSTNLNNSNIPIPISPPASLLRTGSLSNIKKSNETKQSNIPRLNNNNSNANLAPAPGSSNNINNNSNTKLLRPGTNESQLVTLRRENDVLHKHVQRLERLLQNFSVRQSNLNNAQILRQQSNVNEQLLLANNELKMLRVQNKKLREQLVNNPAKQPHTGQRAKLQDCPENIAFL
jgi:hypothetical protein